MNLLRMSCSDSDFLSMFFRLSGYPGPFNFRFQVAAAQLPAF
ncbi:hypothetical protein BPC006_II0573 [Burkholderia pseudomallei BPC006]|nr:hypothetical protein BPC006_II0573 [Burkholderia pseudomallei BPC006]